MFWQTNTNKVKVETQTQENNQTNTPMNIQENSGDLSKKLQQLQQQLQHLKTELQQDKISGGEKSKKKTKERILVEGKNCIIYTGPRGGKYIKKNSKFVSVQASHACK
jgi:hypothetical protein